MSIRECFVWFFIGHNRTGKSVTARIIAEAYKESDKKRKVIAFDPQSRFEGLVDKKIPVNVDWSVYKKERNCLFIIDDYKIVCPNDRLDPDLLELLAYRNEYGLDFIFICWKPKLIMPRIAIFITKISLFYTAGGVGQFKNRTDDPEVMEKLSEIVNNFVKKNGKGNYPNFPHVCIDFQSGTIQAFNLTNQKQINKSNELIGD